MSDRDNDKIRLVAKNDPAQIATEYAHQKAESAMTNFVANLLRVIAGAGQPDAVITNMHDTLAAWLEFDKAAGWHQPTPMPSLPTLDALFEPTATAPQTEDQWRQWATDDPMREFHDERDRIVRVLRTAVLREIAGKMTGHPFHVSTYGGQITQAMRDYQRAHETLAASRDRPPRPAPYRQQIAADAIDKLREQARDDMIAGLRTDQFAALRAVQSGAPEGFNAFDAFTFDVLGRMGLLRRKPDSRKSKRDWELTDLGTLALSREPRS